MHFNSEQPAAFQEDEIFSRQQIKMFAEHISKGELKTIQNLSALEKSVLQESSVFQSALQKRMEDLLSYGQVDDFQQLITLNLHTKEIIQAIQPALQKRMEDLLSYGQVDDFQQLIALNLHTEETVQSALQNAMEGLLSGGFVDDFQQLITLNLHTKEIIQAIQPALQERMERLLSGDFVDDFQKLIALNLHTKETIQAIQPALQKAMENLLSYGWVENFQQLVDLNLHTKETIQAIQPALQERMERLLSRDFVDDFRRLAALNLHTKETIQAIQPALQRVMEILLSGDTVDNFQKLIDLNLHTKETIQAIQPALQKRIKDLLLYGWGDDFQKLIALNLHTKETIQAIQPALQKAMEVSPLRSWGNNFQKFVDLNLHTEETIQSALQKAMENLLWYGQVDDFQQLIALNLHTFDVTQEPWLQPALQKAMKNLLSENRLDYSGFRELAALNLHTKETIQAIQPALQKAMENLLSYSHVDGFQELIDLNLHTEDIFVNIYKTFLANDTYSPIITLASYSSTVKEKWDSFVENMSQNAYSDKVSTEECEKARKLLTYFATKGSPEILEQASVYLRTRKGASKDEPLTVGQETALYIYEHLNSQETNKELFNLLVTDALPIESATSLARHLVKGETQFATTKIRKAMRKYLYNGDQETGDVKPLSWDQGIYLQKIFQIPSTGLRNLALEVVGADTFTREGVLEKHEERPHIPHDVFLQCLALEDVQVGVLDYLTSVFTRIRNSESSKLKFLFSLTKLVQLPTSTQSQFLRHLVQIPCTTEMDVQSLNTSIRMFLFAVDIPKLIQNKGGYYDDGGQWIESEKSDGADTSNAQLTLEAIFVQPSQSFTELEASLNKYVSYQIQEVLPHKKITGEQFWRLQESWGDIEPILTYLSRYQNNKDYIAEVVAHADTREAWQKWRYDTRRPSVKEQIGFLDDGARAIWRDVQVEKIETVVQESDLSKPEQIQNQIIEAIVRDRHLVEGEKKYFWSQEYLENVLKHDEGDVDINKKISQALAELQTYTSLLGEYALSFDIPKVENILRTIFKENGKVAINAKTKAAIDMLRLYCNEEVFKTCVEAYKKYNKDGVKEVAIEDIFSSEIRSAIQKKVADIMLVHTRLTQGGVWEKLGIKESDFGNRGVVYQMIRELSGCINILRLSTLTISQLMTNVLVEGKVKKEGLAVSAAIVDLQKTYEKSSFVGNMHNIEVLIGSIAETRKEKSLAIIFSDNPSLLWQAGKYPLGNGSCQEYATGSMAQSLMGYVGDAHTKVLYMFDVNKLPLDAQSRLSAGESLKSVVTTLPPLDILQAVVTRSIVKMGKTGKKIPTLFIEPVYTTLNKKNHEVDRTVIEFLSEYVAKPIYGRVTKGEGSSVVRIHIPASTNPDGQYEDGAYGNAAHAGQGIKHGSYTLDTHLWMDFSQQNTENENLEHFEEDEYNDEDDKSDVETEEERRLRLEREVEAKEDVGWEIQEALERVGKRVVRRV